MRLVERRQFHPEKEKGGGSGKRILQLWGRWERAIIGRKQKGHSDNTKKGVWTKQGTPFFSEPLKNKSSSRGERGLGRKKRKSRTYGRNQ